MIRFQEALDRLLAGVAPMSDAIGGASDPTDPQRFHPEIERVPVREAAGRVLAEDIVAPFDLPMFDYSAMDGYAFRAADFLDKGGAPFTFEVRGESAAGRPLPAFVPGAACRIFTGARLPEGADAVIPQEDVTLDASSGVPRVTIAAAPKPGAHVRRRGEDLRAGVVAIARGSRVTPGRAALAGALDQAMIPVTRRPRVTILCTGDELRAPGEPGVPGSIAESNSIFVADTARNAGAIVRVAPYVADDLAVAEAAVRDAIQASDLVVTIGGVSVGDHDVMKEALVRSGFALDFWRVAIKPGKPLCVGRAASRRGSGTAERSSPSRPGAAFALGLPGNPASASLTFLLFGVPLLRAMQGDAAPVPARVPIVVRGTLRRAPGRMELLRCRLIHEGTRVAAEIMANQASGAVTSFAAAEALVVVPEDRTAIDDGDVLDAIRIVDM